MRLNLLVGGKHKIYAYVDERLDESGVLVQSRCQYLEELLELSRGVRGKDCEKLQEIMDNYSKYGTSKLSSEQFKSTSVPRNDVYEFKRGRVRAYCFVDEGEDGENIVVLTCCLLKKDKPDKKEVDRCRRLRERYFESKVQGTVVFTTN